jgi:hypothetical protein
MKECLIRLTKIINKKYFSDANGGKKNSEELRSPGGRYDSVCPSPKSDDDDSDEANIQIKLPTAKAERFTTLPRAGERRRQNFF